eukprot:scaffold2897_cov178-Amphora_coffeaeformis.AAC.25
MVVSLPNEDARAVLMLMMHGDGYCCDGGGEYREVPLPVSEILPVNLPSYLVMTIHHKEPLLAPGVTNHPVHSTPPPLGLDRKAGVADEGVDGAAHDDNDRPRHHQQN